MCVMFVERLLRTLSHSLTAHWKSVARAGLWGHGGVTETFGGPTMWDTHTDAHTRHTRHTHTHPRFNNPPTHDKTFVVTEDQINAPTIIYALILNDDVTYIERWRSGCEPLSTTSQTTYGMWIAPSRIGHTNSPGHHNQCTSIIQTTLNSGLIRHESSCLLTTVGQ